MSKTRDAVEQLRNEAMREFRKVSRAVSDDYRNADLKRRIADFNAGRGEYANGGVFPQTGTAKLIDTFMPRYGCGAFDKAYQWACEQVRPTPSAIVDLPKIEAVYKAHHAFLEACREVADRGESMVPPLDEWCDSINALSHSFALSMPVALPPVDVADPFNRIAAKAAMLADNYPVVRAEVLRLETCCETDEFRAIFRDDLAAESGRWHELEQERHLLFTLMVEHMPASAKQLREISKAGKWSVHDKGVDLDAAVGELRGIVVEARRLIGTFNAAVNVEQTKLPPTNDKETGSGGVQNEPGSNEPVSVDDLSTAESQVWKQYQLACSTLNNDSLKPKEAYSALEKMYDTVNAETDDRKRQYQFKTLKNEVGDLRAYPTWLTTLGRARRRLGLPTFNSLKSGRADDSGCIVRQDEI